MTSDPNINNLTLAYQTVKVDAPSHTLQYSPPNINWFNIGL